MERVWAVENFSSDGRGEGAIDGEGDGDGETSDGDGDGDGRETGPTLTGTSVTTVAFCG